MIRFVSVLPLLWDQSIRSMFRRSSSSDFTIVKTFLSSWKGCFCPRLRSVQLPEIVECTVLLLTCMCHKQYDVTCKIFAGNRMFSPGCFWPDNLPFSHIHNFSYHRGEKTYNFSIPSVKCYQICKNMLQSPTVDVGYFQLKNRKILKG